MYKRQGWDNLRREPDGNVGSYFRSKRHRVGRPPVFERIPVSYTHLTLPDERSSVDLGGRRIIKKKKRGKENEKKKDKKEKQIQEIYVKDQEKT